MKLKPNIRNYWDDIERYGGADVQEEVVGGMAWEADAVGLRKQGRKIVDFKPKEGRGWSLATVRIGATHETRASIPGPNWVSSAESQALGAFRDRVWSPNARLVDYLDAETKKVYHELGIEYFPVTANSRSQVAVLRHRHTLPANIRRRGPSPGRNPLQILSRGPGAA